MEGRAIPFERRSPPIVSEPAWEYAPGPEPARPLSVPLSAGPSTEQEMLATGPRIIGQLGDTYILCETAEGLMIVDQHAAHERIVYEHLKKSLAAGKIEMQTLLIPHELELSTKETRILLERGEGLRRFGLELGHFGGNTFLLTSVPALLKNVNWQTFVSELVFQLAENIPDQDTLFEACTALMACHGAIRAGQRLTRDEMDRLLSQLAEMDLPTNCPHGRPIFRQLTFPEMERMFKRVV